MTGDLRRRRTVRLEGLPRAAFDAAVTYLGDVLRECQLVLVASGQGDATDPMLAELAQGLVPDLEEVRDAVNAGSITEEPGASVVIVTTLEEAQAATLAHLHMQLIQLQLLEQRGQLLLRSHPTVTQLLAWIWDEASHQLHGRPPRRYRLA